MWAVAPQFTQFPQTIEGRSAVLCIVHDVSIQRCTATKMASACTHVCSCRSDRTREGCFGTATKMFASSFMRRVDWYLWFCIFWGLHENVLTKIRRIRIWIETCEFVDEHDHIRFVGKRFFIRGLFANFQIGRQRMWCWKHNVRHWSELCPDCESSYWLICILCARAMS